MLANKQNNYRSNMYLTRNYNCLYIKWINW